MSAEDNEQAAVLANELKHATEQIRALTEQLGKFSDLVEKKYVTLDRFQPVEKIAYGLVGAVLLAVAAGVLKLIIH
jgi:hypothetical protein